MAKRILGRIDVALFLVLIVLFSVLTVLPKEVRVQKSVEIVPAEGYTTHMKLPAVDDSGKGIVTTLEVNVRPGSGRVLTDIDKLLFWIDTQQSIQTAKSYAANYTGIDTSNLDITYTLDAKVATLVGGPSAGAGLTIATIAALENRTLKDSVMITGTINGDGSIGVVGGTVEKAGAAKNAGAELFLVPVGESTESYVKPNEKCTKEPGFVYCQTTYDKVTINVAKDISIDVREVSNIREALGYFLK